MNISNERLKEIGKLAMSRKQQKLAAELAKEEPSEQAQDELRELDEKRPSAAISVILFAEQLRHEMK